MYEKKILKDFNCGITATMEVIGGKWKTCLINRINKGTKRPSELHRAYPHASARVLNQQLAELEMHHVLEKTIYQVLPPKVEYNLTELGRSLLPLISCIESWGLDHADVIKNNDHN